MQNTEFNEHYYNIQISERSAPSSKGGFFRKDEQSYGNFDIGIKIFVVL
jgi:hypothetical protein